MNGITSRARKNRITIVGLVMAISFLYLAYNIRLPLGKVNSAPPPSWIKDRRIFPRPGLRISPHTFPWLMGEFPHVTPKQKPLLFQRGACFYRF